MRIFDEVRANFEALGHSFELEDAADLNGVIQFVLTGAGGGQFVVTITAGHLQVVEGRSSAPDALITLEASDYLAITRNEADPFKLAMSGRMYIEGDRMLVMQFRAKLRESYDGSSRAETPIDLERDLTQRFRPERAGDLNIIIQIVLTGPGGGEFVVRIVSGRLEVEVGQTTAPDLVLTMEASDYRAVMWGEVNPMSLVMSGRMHVEGDRMLAMRFPDLFAVG
jgi:putative sterol carrier protein